MCFCHIALCFGYNSIYRNIFFPIGLLTFNRFNDLFLLSALKRVQINFYNTDAFSSKNGTDGFGDQDPFGSAFGPADKPASDGFADPFTAFGAPATNGKFSFLLPSELLFRSCVE